MATSETPPLTRHVAEFISSTRFGDIPADVIDAGRKSILDGLGLAIAGSVAESGHIITAYLADLCAGAAGNCTVLGTDLKVPARFAAFANGVAIHADDYDDTQLAVAKDRVYGLLMHPTAPVLPAALAAAEATGASGADFCTAYHIGIEVCCKVAEAANPRHYQDGFHTTGTCGVLGAAASAASVAISTSTGRRGARHRRQPIVGLPRKLRHHDQAVPPRPFRRERHRGGRSGQPRLFGDPNILEAPRFLSRGGRR